MKCFTLQEKVVEIEQCNSQKNNFMCGIVIKKWFVISYHLRVPFISCRVCKRIFIIHFHAWFATNYCYKYRHYLYSIYYWKYAKNNQYRKNIILDTNGLKNSTGFLLLSKKPLFLRVCSWHRNNHLSTEWRCNLDGVLGLYYQWEQGWFNVYNTQ